MKKYIPYITLIPAVFFALIPLSINFCVDINMDLWMVLVLVAGFFGLYTLLLEINPFLKIISVGALINCICSRVPYFSFTSYISVIACVYFYLLCLKIEDWRPVFKAFQVIIFFNVLFMFMQSFNKDNLLNFGLIESVHFGIIGQSMQMGSFSVVLASILINSSPLNFAFPFLMSFICVSTWTFISAGAGLSIYAFSKNKKLAFLILVAALSIFMVFAYKQHKFSANLNNNGRIGVWKKSISLANKHPIVGYGIGTYKVLFPLLSRTNSTPWKTAHNIWVQLLFEIGYLGVAVVWFFNLLLFYFLWKSKNYLCLSGFTMLNVNWLVAFPDRMLQAVLIMILFLAYCARQLKSNPAR